MTVFMLVTLVSCGKTTKPVSDYEENKSSNDIKKIVWIGNSIPAGEHENSYVNIIRESLSGQIDITKVAIGSSSLRAGAWKYITTSDEYGFSGLHWNTLLNSLTLSSEEKMEIINNWDIFKSQYDNAPETITNEEKTRYLNSSYDNLLKPYLLPDSDIDIFVIDHGYNDYISKLGQEAESEITRLPEKRGDRTYFIGAYQFIIDLIMKERPDAKILLIGFYENDKRIGICAAQEKVADMYNIPLLKTWEFTNWTQEMVTVNGFWKDGVWIEEKDQEEELTVLESWLPDGIHPHSDKSGKANTYLAEIIKPFIVENVR